MIDHMADCPVDQPEELEKLIALKRYPKVFVKDLAYLVDFEAAVSVAGFAGARQAAARGFGPQRLMWATDWPISKKDTDYAHTLRWFATT